MAKSVNIRIKHTRLSKYKSDIGRAIPCILILHDLGAFGNGLDVEACNRTDRADSDKF